MHEMDQRSDEWKQIRLGKVTASRIADATAKTKTGWGASRANYMAELLSERLTGTPREGFTNAAMQWGIDMEPQARRVYEFMEGADVHEVGFAAHPTIEMSGASPDGLVGDLGLVEIKCPDTATHIETLLGSRIDGKYIKQMQWQMACTARSWCDFVSFDPRLPERMQIHVERVYADSAFIAELERDIREFLSELDAKEAALLEKFGEMTLPPLMAGE
jgi:putative phage-type endonuclease